MNVYRNRLVGQGSMRFWAGVALVAFAGLLWFGHPIRALLESLYLIPGFMDFALQNGFSFSDFTLAEAFFGVALIGGLATWAISEQLSVDPLDGVRLFFGTPALPFAHSRWQAMRKVTIIGHGQNPSTALIQYKSCFGFSWKVGIHARRFVNGNDAVRAIELTAIERGIPCVRVEVARYNLVWGWALIATGLIYFGVETFIPYVAVRRYLALSDPSGHWLSLGDPTTLASLHIAFAVLVSAGFAKLSVYHRAGPRTGLLILWLLGLLTTADLTLNPYISDALYAIWAAQMTPVLPNLRPIDSYANGFQVTAVAQYALILIVPLSYYGMCALSLIGTRGKPLDTPARQSIQTRPAWDL